MSNRDNRAILARIQNGDGIFWRLLILGLSIGLVLFTFRVRLPIFGRVEWRRIEEFWPGFILIGGLAYLGQFVLGGFKDLWAGISGAVICAIGGLALVSTLDLIYLPWLRVWTSYWPIWLVVLSVWIVGHALVRWR